jgi:hypothetical protein
MSLPCYGQFFEKPKRRRLRSRERRRPFFMIVDEIAMCIWCSDRARIDVTRDGTSAVCSGCGTIMPAKWVT